MTIIICKHSKYGYSASLRFNDSSRDVELSSDDHEGIYKAIERYVKKNDC